jgi:hypothetical protein
MIVCVKLRRAPFPAMVVLLIVLPNRRKLRTWKDCHGGGDQKAKDGDGEIVLWILSIRNRSSPHGKIPRSLGGRPRWY